MEKTHSGKGKRSSCKTTSDVQVVGGKMTSEQVLWLFKKVTKVIESVKTDLKGLRKDALFN